MKDKESCPLGQSRIWICRGLSDSRSAQCPRLQHLVLSLAIPHMDDPLAPTVPSEPLQVRGAPYPPTYERWKPQESPQGLALAQGQSYHLGGKMWGQLGCSEMNRKPWANHSVSFLWIPLLYVEQICRPSVLGGGRC